MDDIKNVVDYDVIGEEAHPRLVAITLMEYRQLVSDVARLQAELDRKTSEYNRLWSENNMFKSKAEAVKIK